MDVPGEGWAWVWAWVWARVWVWVYAWAWAWVWSWLGLGPRLGTRLKGACVYSAHAVQLYQSDIGARECGPSWRDGRNSTCSGADRLWSVCRAGRMQAQSTCGAR